MFLTIFVLFINLISLILNLMIITEQSTTAIVNLCVIGISSALIIIGYIGYKKATKIPLPLQTNKSQRFDGKIWKEIE